jgi:uncharacterized protein (DUF58 family)
MEKKLNLDIPGSVSELEMLMKKVLPRNILYQLILGRGLEFDGFREFSQSDDAINIDWKTSARAGKLLIKKYIEERDLKFIFVVDVSDNMVFGSTEKLKCEYSAELTAALAHLILTVGDRVGFVLFNDNVVKMRPPKMGTKPFEILVSILSDPSVYGGKVDLKKVLDGLSESLDKSTSLVFIISDFVKVDETYKKTFEEFAALFETISIIVRDPLDNKFPEINKEVAIESTETGERLLINPKVARGVYERNALKQLNLVRQMFKDNNIDALELMTDRPAAPEIAAFLQERIRGGRIVKIKNVY